MNKAFEDFLYIQGPMLVHHLAKNGFVMPLELAVAARNCPGYDVSKAQGAENQNYNVDGNPITEEEMNVLQIAANNSDDV